MPNIVKTKGIVLHIRQFRDSSLYCSVFTKDYGKINLLARGVRRPRSKLCGTLEPFNHTEIIFYKKEFKETYTLSDASIIDDFNEIRTSNIKFAACESICEFFEKIQPPEEKETKIYEFILSFAGNLRNCSEESAGIYTILHLFRALKFAGVEPHLKDCVRCHKPVLEPQEIQFSMSAGGIVCEDHIDNTMIKLKKASIELIKNTGIAHEKSSENKEIAQEIREFFEDYIYYHLNGIKLNSLKFIFKK